MLKAMLFCICLALAAAAQAQAQQSAFIASGLLQIPNTTVVKLVQLVLIATSPDNALELFSNDMKQKYPDRILIDFVINPVAIPTRKADCGVAI